MTTRQISFALPREQDLYLLEVRNGIYSGVWQVDRQLVRTPSGIFIPYKEGLTAIQAYDVLQNDPALREAGFELAPVTVLLQGVQNIKDFYEMLRGTYQLTGSGIVDSRLLGTPNINRGEDLQYNGLRNDRPIARIEPQHGQVRRLDKTTLWGVGEDSKVESKKPRYPIYMYNADGNRFVELLVRSYGYVEVYAFRHPLDWRLPNLLFDWGARLAKKIE